MDPWNSLDLILAILSPFLDGPTYIELSHNSCIMIASRLSRTYLFEVQYRSNPVSKDESFYSRARKSLVPQRFGMTANDFPTIILEMDNHEQRPSILIN